MSPVPTVLVVEEEFLIALDIQRVLEMLELTHTVFARNLEEARAHAARWPQISLAIVDIRPNDPQTIATVHELMAAGIPVVLTSSDIAVRAGVPGLPGLSVIVKPLPEADLLAAVRQALSSRG